VTDAVRDVEKRRETNRRFNSESINGDIGAKRNNAWHEVEKGGRGKKGT